MLVRILKEEDEIREKFDLTDELENGTIVYNVPENLDTLKKCACPFV